MTPRELAKLLLSSFLIVSFVSAPFRRINGPFAIGALDVWCSVVRAIGWTTEPTWGVNKLTRNNHYVALNHFFTQCKIFKLWYKSRRVIAQDVPVFPLKFRIFWSITHSRVWIWSGANAKTNMQMVIKLVCDDELYCIGRFNGQMIYSSFFLPQSSFMLGHRLVHSCDERRSECNAREKYDP